MLEIWSGQIQEYLNQHPRLQVQVHDHHYSPKMTPFITSQRFRAGRLVFSPKRICHQPLQDKEDAENTDKSCLTLEKVDKNWLNWTKVDKCWQKLPKLDFEKLESRLDANILFELDCTSKNQTKHFSTFQRQLWWRKFSHQALEGEGRQETGPWSFSNLEFQTGSLWIQPDAECEQWYHVDHCTMGKLKNGVKSSQLWWIISLWIWAQNLPNLAQSCLNSPKTQMNTNI